jgi:hypothetical protein
VLGAVKLPRDQPPIPGENGVRFGDSGNLSECIAPQALPDLGEGRTLGIAQPQPFWQLRPENKVSAARYSF